ncbi:MAG: YggT family protein [Candidatus Peribacteria bacterium]|jgi:uncharacterized protein YggT (Ycf19 family)|nr:YggT family protein [Candidatus Peribacteria bacterium]
MTFIIVTILLLTDILFYATFIDVILSWFGVLGMNLRPAFLANILEPIYKRIKSIIPTNF